MTSGISRMDWATNLALEDISDELATAYVFLLSASIRLVCGERTTVQSPDLEEIRNVRSKLSGYVHALTMRTTHSMRVMYGRVHVSSGNKYSVVLFMLPSSADGQALVAQMNAHDIPPALRDARRMREYFNKVSELVLLDVCAVMKLPSGSVLSSGLSSALHASFAQSEDMTARAEVTISGHVSVQVTYTFDKHGYISKLSYDLYEIKAG